MASRPVPPARTLPAWLRNMAADRRAPLVVVGLLIGLASALLLFAGRGNWFFIDDWAFAMGRWDLSPDTIFLAQNRNCCATVVLIYRAMFELFGLGDYLPWRLLLTATIAG